ncbi:cupin [Sphingomonas sp. 37zxx]|uniref:cupin n=1 Tax=Sphingomonas sp. 37zxx TaxID=1550073 RepID=UPI001E3AD126|nr:cupin [Sphingomonas sp. 37zxx]
MAPVGSPRSAKRRDLGQGAQPCPTATAAGTDPAQLANTGFAIDMGDGDETFEALLRRDDVVIERIISHGHVTPLDQPHLQPHDEWVILLQGAARLLVEGQPERRLAMGEHMLIAADARHWVTFTSPSEATVWLAVHLMRAGG